MNINAKTVDLSIVLPYHCSHLRWAGIFLDGKFPRNNNNFLHELALSGFQFFFTSIHMSEVGQILLFSLLVSERQTDILIIKRSHTCRWQSWKEPRSPDTWSPIILRFPEAFPPYHPLRTNVTPHLALFCTYRKHEEFEQSSKLCIFQCSLMVYFSMPFSIKIQRH